MYIYIYIYTYIYIEIYVCMYIPETSGGLDGDARKAVPHAWPTYHLPTTITKVVDDSSNNSSNSNTSNKHNSASTALSFHDAGRENSRLENSQGGWSRGDQRCTTACTYIYIYIEREREI